jgi:hypothetical protein
MASPGPEQREARSVTVRRGAGPAGLLRLYGSVAARAIGGHPTFDPHALVRSTDTLYITASPDR